MLLGSKKGFFLSCGSRLRSPANERCFGYSPFDAISCGGSLFGMPQRFTTGSATPACMLHEVGLAVHF